MSNEEPQVMEQESDTNNSGGDGTEVSNDNASHRKDASSGNDAEDTEAAEESPSAPRGRSIAHHVIDNKKAVFVSFDIAVGGASCGIVQMSAELFRLELVPKGCSITKDEAKNIERNEDTFNKYVNPGEGAVWDDRRSAIHGLSRDHPSIAAAATMTVVWRQFEEWIHSHVGQDETAILIGNKWELKPLWNMTQGPNPSFHMPSKIKYFIDPYDVIGKYSSCLFHENCSFLRSYDLIVLWWYINNRTTLDGAGDSLVDAKAQGDVFTHEYFVPFINRSNSVHLMTDIFSKAETKIMEIQRPNAPVNALGLVPVFGYDKKTCDKAVAWARSTIYYPPRPGANRLAEGDEDVVGIHPVFRGAILGRSSKNPNVRENFVDLGIPYELPGISRNHLKVRSVTPNSTVPSMSIHAINSALDDGTAAGVLLHKTRQGTRSTRNYATRGTVRIGDAITFLSFYHELDFCLVGLIVPPFNIKPLVESNMKLLPYLVNRFDNDKDIETTVDIDTLKLSAIYQFAKAMPMNFVPAPSKKRKSTELARPRRSLRLAAP